MRRSSIYYWLGNATLFGFVALIFSGVPLPPREWIVPSIAHGTPTQEMLALSPSWETRENGRQYAFTPHASYEIEGLVVSLHHSDSIIDVTHENDSANTMDICVVWGPNISTNGYRMVSYDHGDFTCFYRWESEYDPPFSEEFLSNNHLIPSTPEIAALIKTIHVGDQVRFRGTLVDYAITGENGESLGQRRTSLTRSDRGNGACEILYLTEVEILVRHMPWRTPALYGLLLITFLGYIGGFVASMPKKIRSEPPKNTHHENPFNPKNFTKHRK